MSDLKRTPLHHLHVEHNAKMVPFAGYEMPVQYGSGVLAEHRHTRSSAGLFDVSHMGQIILRDGTGEITDSALALEALVPIDVLGLPAMRQRYGFFTNHEGGILDDLMIANRSDHLFLVVNAARKDADLAHMRESPALNDKNSGCRIEEITGRALLALQGPKAEVCLSRILPRVSTMKFMDVAMLEADGIEYWVSRSGYTGEDGFEISVPASAAVSFAEMLLEMDEVDLIGLGARDSLRLEGGLCLYGADLDETTTPVEASVTWAIQKVRRKGGSREGGFPGAKRILNEVLHGPSRIRVGLLPEGRAPMRAGTRLFSSDNDTEQIGQVTSGAFGPTIEKPMSMGYVAFANASIDTRLFGDVRGKRQPVRVTSLPFVPARFKR